MMTQVPAVLKLLLERLRNEITRLPAVKAFTVLAHSKLLLQLDGALEPAVVRPGMRRPTNERHTSFGCIATDSCAGC